MSFIYDCHDGRFTVKKDRKLVFKTNYRLMHVKSIAELEHSAILLTFIKLPVVIKIFVLSIFEWLFYTGFTVGIKFCLGHCPFEFDLE